MNDEEKTGWINASRKYFSICIKMMLTILLDSCPHTPLSEACSVTWDFFINLRWLLGLRMHQMVDGQLSRD